MQIHLDPRIEKSIQALRRSGKKAFLAAERAEEIIGRMRRGQVIPERVGTMTKHGELRIKGVMKYDLGSGYRMITYKNDRRLFLLYVGSHDDCHRWIENNRELTVAQIQERCVALAVEAAICDEDDSGGQFFIEEEEEFDPLASVSEKDLRQVFCGLVNSVARGIESP